MRRGDDIDEERKTEAPAAVNRTVFPGTTRNRAPVLPGEAARQRDRPEPTTNPSQMARLMELVEGLATRLDKV